jgi:putative acetyltransferase
VLSTSPLHNVKIRPSRREDGDRVVNIWRAAVDATHQFLAAEDRQAIDMQVQQFLPHSPLWLAVDRQDWAVGFMALSGSHVDALFIDPAFHDVGIGRQLVSLALRFHPVVTIDVNEQNLQAVGFYERLGFVRFGRSPIDDQGRPYPLLHLRLDPTR